MCILCVIQKWSRRVATMLPWLVIPLIALWFLSQFLPPAFRFEITSPRLACVFVLLTTLFWYEILMPQLSAYRARRNARLKERKRSEAIEMQKLRKTATRRCRNCLTPYRDQNPGGGKFMCCYCGHISKRPVLDLPIPPGLSTLSSSGILKDLVGKGGKMFNGKVWSDNGWICGQESLYFSSFRGNDDHCFAEKSYSRLVLFLHNGLDAVYFGVMWVWRKVFRVSSSDEDNSSDAEIRSLLLAKKGENGVVNCNESRSEKARRKAEEKRQARLEKEQLEEEERKQREEVARLVEERRKLRDEKTEAEKKVSLREKTNKRETEKKRVERKKDKEKDRGSSKSNSDVDELEKRAVKEIERSRNQSNHSLKPNSTNDTLSHGSKISSTHNNNNNISNNNIGNVGTRYLDRMKGSFLSSSRAFTGGGFFGKGTISSTNTNANSTTREHNKASATLEHVQNTANRRDLSQSDHAVVKSNASTDDKNINRHVASESQAPKKSWQQLFTRTPTSNVISRPNGNPNPPKEIQTPISSVTQGFDNPITFGLPYTLPNFSYADPIINNNNTFSNPIFPPPDKTFLPEESDIFEDPCYVPDPVSLIGPVSESLDNFQLDLGFENSKKEEDKGWQMWDSSGPATWRIMQQQPPPPQHHKTMASLFKKDDPQIYDPWHNNNNNNLGYGSLNGSAATNHLSQANFWAKKERGVGVSVEGNKGSASTTTRPVGGLYSTPDVQSLWSYE